MANFYGDPDSAVRQMRLAAGLKVRPLAPSMSDPLPPSVSQTKPAPPMSTPLPPLATVNQAPPMSTPTPPIQTTTWSGMQTGGNQQRFALPSLNTTSAPPPSSGLPPLAAPTAPTLPSINGNQFVATGTAPAQQNVTQMIQQLQSAFPGTSNESIVGIMKQLQAAFPNNAPDVISIIKQMQAAFPEKAKQDPNALVQAAVAQFTERGNPYIDRARQRGLDFANQRGLLNSSMAAGSAEGAAIDAALPFIQESLGITNRREAEDFAARQNAISQGMALTGQREGQDAAFRQAAFGAGMNLHGQRENQRFQSSQNAINQAMQLNSQREGQAWQGYQNQLDRVQGVNNALLSNQLAERQAQLADYYSRGQMVLDGQIRQRIQADSVAQQDWLNSNSFSREFNGALSMMPIRNAYDMASAIQQYALREPEVYTPTVISGMTNFFQQNMLSILSQYFPNLVNAGGG